MRCVMKYPWFDDYCLAKSGATKDYKAEWEAERFFLGDKIFCLKYADKSGKPIISLKCEPAFGHMLREQYAPHIVPGYHMNKEHWNSVYIDGDVPDGILKQMIDMSYSLVLASLTKKRRQQLLGGPYIS